MLSWRCVKLKKRPSGPRNCIYVKELPLATLVSVIRCCPDLVTIRIFFFFKSGLCLKITFWTKTDIVKYIVYLIDRM